MSLRSRPGPRPTGFIAPALPFARGLPPSGSEWIHEIKFDGFRLLARRVGPRVRLFTRNGYDWTERFPLIRAGMLAVKAQSCLVDGEAVCCEVDGVPSFEPLRYRHHDGAVFLYAFDLLELDGRDIQRMGWGAWSVGILCVKRGEPVMKASILTFSAATFLVIACVPVGAQQTSGTPGSPSATTTIDGKQLPPPTQSSAA